MRRYPSYKESGIEWIGAIPIKWKLSRLKYQTQITSSSIDKKFHEGCNEYPVIHYNDIIRNKKIGKKEIVDVGYCSEIHCEAFRVLKGDLIVTKDSMDIRNIGDSSIIIDDLEMCVFGYHLTKFSAKSSILYPEYLFYHFNNPSIKEFFLINSNGTTIIGVSKSTFGNTPVYLPSLPEQEQIAAFLNHKTKLIDNLIAKTERKIELLNELRTATINQAVTKGLDPDVEMKDSGVEWIGEIPKGWEAKKLTYVTCLIGSGTTPKSDNLEYYENGNIPWLTTGELNDSEINSVRNRVTSLAMNDYPSLKVYPDGAVSIAMYGATIGKLGVLRLPTTVNQANCVFVFTGDNNPKFWFYVLLAYRPKIVSLGYGGGQPNISQDLMKSIRFGCPTKEKQIQIADYLDSATRQGDTHIKREYDKIELLKEYRQSLISEVVTGKIDVSDEVIS
jgi:type I restriction enzyme, S subunit